MGLAETIARRQEEHLSFEIWGVTVNKVHVQIPVTEIVLIGDKMFELMAFCLLQYTQRLLPHRRLML